MRLIWEPGMRFRDLEQGPERFSLEPGVYRRAVMIVMNINLSPFLWMGINKRYSNNKSVPFC